MTKKKVATSKELGEPTRFCDVCNKDVNVGTGGQANWDAHVGSKNHVKAAAQALSSGRERKITTFFSKPVQPPSHVPGPSKISLYNNFTQRNLHSTSSDICDLTLDSEDSTAVSLKPSLHPAALHATSALSRDSVPSSSSTSSTMLISVLRTTIKSLPVTVAIGQLHEPLACFAIDPVLPVNNDEYESAWQFVDQVLNRVIGFGASDSDIAQLISRGPLGMDGLCRWIEVVLTWPGVSAELLEGKVNRLCRAMAARGAIVNGGPTESMPGGPAESLPDDPTGSLKKLLLASYHHLRQLSHGPDQ
ncbi:hypothetical protein BKA93DRAFT_829917 [Sparassis latifolia]